MRGALVARQHWAWSAAPVATRRYSYRSEGWASTVGVQQVLVLDVEPGVDYPEPVNSAQEYTPAWETCCCPMAAFALWARPAYWEPLEVGVPVQARAARFAAEMLSSQSDE
jgi:hypothetical protein